MVGDTGLEPVTFCMSSRRSNQAELIPRKTNENMIPLIFSSVKSIAWKGYTRRVPSWRRRVPRCLSRARCCDISLHVAAPSEAPGANLSRLVSLVSRPPVMSEGVRQEDAGAPSARRSRASVPLPDYGRQLGVAILGRDVLPHVRRAGPAQSRRKPQVKDSPSPHLYTAQPRIPAPSARRPCGSVPLSATLNCASGTRPYAL